MQNTTVKQQTPDNKKSSVLLTQEINVRHGSCLYHSAGLLVLTVSSWQHWRLQDPGCRYLVRQLLGVGLDGPQLVLVRVMFHMIHLVHLHSTLILIIVAVEVRWWLNEFLSNEIRSIIHYTGVLKAVHKSSENPRRLWSLWPMNSDAKKYIWHVRTRKLTQSHLTISPHLSKTSWHRLVCSTVKRNARQTSIFLSNVIRSPPPSSRSPYTSRILRCLWKKARSSFEPDHGLAPPLCLLSPIAAQSLPFHWCVASLPMDVTPSSDWSPLWISLPPTTDVSPAHRCTGAAKFLAFMANYPEQKQDLPVALMHTMLFLSQMTICMEEETK